MQIKENFYIQSCEGNPHHEAFYGVVCIYALLERRISEFLKTYDLSPVKFNTLMLVKHKGGKEGLSQNEISQHLIVSPSNITRLLDRLTKDGLIERCAHASDRRVNLIKITKKASQILDKAWPSYSQSVKDMTALLPAQEVKNMSKLLLKWFAQLENYGH